MHEAPLRYVAGLPTPARALVMGVVNVTPDSFSDGGRWLEPDRAVEHGRQPHREGADLADVGGEATRGGAAGAARAAVGAPGGPGAGGPAVQGELDRVLPVVTALTAEGLPVSVDTMRAEVA